MLSEGRLLEEGAIKWLFDGTSTDAFDLVGSFVCRDGTLLFKLRSWGGSENYEPIVARKPNRRTVKIKLPLNLAEFDENRLELVARSTEIGGETCIERVDRAPNEGRLMAY